MPLPPAAAFFRLAVIPPACAALVASALEGAPVLVKPALVPAAFGETLPRGWMLRQMSADLHDGIAGNFPHISDTVNRGLFAKQSAKSDSAPHTADDDMVRRWWSGEHEGYYADGFFRLAWLSGDAEKKREAIARLEAVLKAQGVDGYIGIYAPECRLPDKGPDGELWTQSRMFQALLAYHEATGDRRILAAVERAVKLTLSRYEGKTYFSRAGSKDGGVSHGVGFADTLEWLYRLTGDEAYRRGLLWLYADYAKGGTRDLDMTPSSLADVQKPWVSHAPHIAEALALPVVAYAFDGTGKYVAAASQVLPKLARHSNPGGGLVGDEAVRGRSGSFSNPAEYCSFTESVASLNRFACYASPMATAEIVERIALNAAQSARTHVADTGVSYLTSDNRSEASANKAHGDRPLYSADHVAASCCALNSTRLLPYYVEGMWMKETGRPGLVARLYGPSVFSGKVGDVPVRVNEDTAFPFSDKVIFEITPALPARFTLTLRIPSYAPDAVVRTTGNAVSHRFSDRVELEGEWKPGDRVTLDFAFKARRIGDASGLTALAYGPLLYALPMEAKATPGRITRAREADGPAFRDVAYEPAEKTPGYRLTPDAVFSPVALPDGDSSEPWAHPPVGLSGSLAGADGTSANVTLAPMGSTILRVTGFAPAK